VTVPVGPRIIYPLTSNNLYLEAVSQIQQPVVEDEEEA